MEGLEAYILPKCNLTARIALTCQSAVPIEQRTFINDNIHASGELLLIIVHRKDWKCPERETSSSSMHRKEVSNVAVARRLAEELKKESAFDNARQQQSNLKDSYNSNISVLATTSKDIEMADMHPSEVPMTASSGAISLPEGLDLEKISNLAAMFGVTSSASSAQVKAESSIEERMGSLSTMPMAATMITTNNNLNVMENMQFQSNLMLSTNMSFSQVVSQIDPQQQRTVNVKNSQMTPYLIFDPSTSRIATLDLKNVKYDPVTNKAVIVGPLPPGIPVPGITASKSVPYILPSSTNQQRVMVNKDGKPVFLPTKRGFYL